MARSAPQAQARRAPQSSGLRGSPLLTRPTIPFLNPAPLSAWILAGFSVAKPQPLASTCACQLGPGSEPCCEGATAAGAPRPPPNTVMTGMGPFALAGVLRESWMSTVMAGYDELS